MVPMFSIWPAGTSPCLPWTFFSRPPGAFAAATMADTAASRVSRGVEPVATWLPETIPAMPFWALTRWLIRASTSHSEQGVDCFICSGFTLCKTVRAWVVAVS